MARLKLLSLLGLLGTQAIAASVPREAADKPAVAPRGVLSVPVHHKGPDQSKAKRDAADPAIAERGLLSAPVKHSSHSESNSKRGLLSVPVKHSSHSESNSKREVADEAALAPRKILSFPVQRTEREESRSESWGLARRDTELDTDTTVFNYSSISYLVELDLGSPAQTVKVVIDTGSSELWVNPDCSNAASIPQQMECVDNGSYNPSDSDTADITRLGSELRYGLGDAQIRYVRDQIALPDSDVKLDDVMFGVATESTYMSHGILGLSFGNDINMKYNSFVDELVEQELVDTRTVSIALGAKEEQENSGLITFGGVDTKKYIGKLHTSPILEPQNNESLWRYWVDLDGVAISDKNGKSKTYSDETFPVFFDTGSTLSYLPKDIVEALAKDLGARYNSIIQQNVIPCDQVGQLHFTFGNTTIDVDLQEFMWELSDGVTCAMGAEPDDSGSYILGASFLRSVYTVFDMETPALHFAHYANCGTNLQEIPTGKNAAAQFEGECSKDDIPNVKTSGSNRNSKSDEEDEDDDDSAAPRYAVGGAMWTSVALVVVYQFVGWLL